MKALVKQAAAPGLTLTSVPEPTIGPNDVLIRVKKTGICGTDVHIYDWDQWAASTIRIPTVIGHEFMGEIVELGASVVGLSVGDRVSGEGHLTCGHCRACRAGRRHLCRNTIGIGVNRDGCFAEYLSLPASNVFVLPPDIPDRIAAILDPLGNAVHTALSFDLVAEDVLIMGAGPIGIMAAMVAQSVGARHVVLADINPYRLELATKVGVTHVINPSITSLTQTMAALQMREGFDVGLEMSGSGQALRDLMGAMDHGGRVAILGIPPAETSINWNDVIFKGLVLKGVYGREMFETWYKMASLLQSGLAIAPIITHEFPADAYEEGFELMRSGQSGKIVLDW